MQPCTGGWRLHKGNRKRIMVTLLLAAMLAFSACSTVGGAGGDVRSSPSNNASVAGDSASAGVLTDGAASGKPAGTNDGAAAGKTPAADESGSTISGDGTLAFASDAVLTPGSDETSLGLCWEWNVPPNDGAGNANGATTGAADDSAAALAADDSVATLAAVPGEVLLVPLTAERAASLVTGSPAGSLFLDSNGMRETGVRRIAGTAEAEPEAGGANAVFACHAVLDGLAVNTSYAWSCDGTVVEGVFHTLSADPLRFLFLGDAQLGAGGNLEQDATGWEETLRAALKSMPDAAFAISSGDQVNAYGGDEDEYNAFFRSGIFRSLPFMPVVGNHDIHAAYLQHFTLPNLSETQGATEAGGDAWFRYGSVLFLVLNTNNEDAAAHDAFIREAVKANPDAAWRVAVHHQSLYAAAEHVADVADLRAALAPVFEANGVDVVLAGHDHCYVRSKPLLGGEVSGDGIVYITADSSSGSSWSDPPSEGADVDPLLAMVLQPHRLTFMTMEVTAETFSMKLIAADTGETLDSTEVRK